MTVTAIVRLNGELATSGTLGAFVGSVVRGVIGANALVFGPYAGSGGFLMTIYANSAGETVTFQFDTGSVQAQCSTTTTFVSDGIVGNVVAPFEVVCTAQGGDPPQLSSPSPPPSASPSPPPSSSPSPPHKSHHRRQSRRPTLRR